MTVPLQSITLIVPRSTLDARVPGSTEGFLREMRKPSRRVRTIAADEHLVAVSFRNRGRAKAPRSATPSRSIGAGRMLEVVAQVVQEFGWSANTVGDGVSPADAVAQYGAGGRR